jgi:simple sugar transport system permease protein
VSAPIELPRWADVALVPAVSVACAFLVAGLVVVGIGESPLSATRALLVGSLGSGEGIGFTLFYATNFIFTGLAVAVAFHAGLFNIGGEGQAALGGLGAALACLHLSFLPGILLIPVAILAAAAFGAGWAWIPGYLQAKRGSHIVITTIMFNWLASVLMVYLLVNVLREPPR